MLRLLGWTIKVATFALIILVIGNLVRIKGETLSDQVKLRMSATERTKIARDVRDFSGKLLRDAQKSGLTGPWDQETIQPSERQKLKALIHELNHSASH